MTSSASDSFGILEGKSPLRAIAASTSLGDVLRQDAAGGDRLAVVRNENGRIEGILNLEEASKLVSSGSAREMARWSSTPAGCVAVPLERPPAGERCPVEDGDAGAIADEDGVAAIVRNGRTYVDWRRIEGALAQSLIDPVTQLPGRRAFDRRLREEIDRASRNGEPLAVVLVDLDRFKDVNDRYGHGRGDEVLRGAAQALRGDVRSYDFVARCGGDEFAVVLSGCPPQEIERPLRRILGLFSADSGVAGGQVIPVTASLGAAVMEVVSDATPVATIVDQADACLYEAKRAGRANAFCVELAPSGEVRGVPRRI